MSEIDNPDYQMIFCTGHSNLGEIPLTLNKTFGYTAFVFGSAGARPHVLWCDECATVGTQPLCVEAMIAP